MKTEKVRAQDDSNPFFSDAARELMGAVMRSLNATHPGWTLADVVRILENRDYTAQVLARSERDVDEDVAPQT
jgi:hypothetical protein